MARILVAVVAVVLLSCAMLEPARPGATFLRPPPGEPIACPESRPSSLAYLGCAVPFLSQEVCANRMENFCVSAPCNQPWYNRCSSTVACSDEQVMNFVPGACVETQVGDSS